MNMTINISLPKRLYREAKDVVEKRGYTSFSELLRNALREYLYPGALTENGFTPEFEERVLKAAKESIDKSRVWRSEKDIDEYFEKLRKELKIKRKNGKN